MKDLLYSLIEWMNHLPFAAKVGAEDMEVTFEHLQEWSIWSGGTGIVLLVVLLALLYVIHQGRQWFWRVADRCLSSAFVVVWLLGFVVYDIGMYTGERPSLFLNMPMAVLHAFGMFLLDSDVSAIHNPFHENYIFMCAFSIAHFLAAVVSMIFVVRHFGYNIIAWFRMRFASSWFGGKRNNIYVFWGMNDATYYLTKSIQDYYKDKDIKDETYRIVVVRTNHDQESNSVRNGMERLFHFLSLRNEDLERLEDMECLTTNTFANLSQLGSNGGKQHSDILKKELGLNRLAKLITRKTTKDVHLFFLSDDEHENIQAVANLKRDSTILSVLSASKEEVALDQGLTKRKVLMYCHARYNSIHRVIEDEVTHNDMKIKVVDTSHISVELLKKKEELHPVRFVDVNKEAKVSSAFHALVVGFGEVGLDAVRFLYEFGAFVKAGSSEEDVKRSDFHCDVVDKMMSQRAGLFAINAPRIQVETPFSQEQGQTSISRRKGEALITLHEADCQSVEFYQLVKERIDQLNYVVLAMDSDEMNISLGIRILRLAIQNRKQLNNLCVMVRVRHDEDGHIHRIAEHYNLLWQAEAKDDAPSCPIQIFGTVKEAYSYKNIIDDQLEKDAKDFYDVYRNGMGEDWDERHRKAIFSDEHVPTYGDVMGVRRKEYQDFANSLHQETKQWMLEKATGKKLEELLAGIEREDIKQEYVTEKGEKKERLVKIQYVDAEGKDIDKKVRGIIDVLAQTEHLRWNASHEILGYEEGEPKDEARLKHDCLKDWQGLTLDTKSYDYNVVDVSLGIHQQKR